MHIAAATESKVIHQSTCELVRLGGDVVGHDGSGNTSACSCFDEGCLVDRMLTACGASRTQQNEDGNTMCLEQVLQSENDFSIAMG
jgi:hypothetical protein